MADKCPSLPLDRLERAASRLRPIEREALLLGARDGLSNEEIAARLGITPRAARRVQARALARLDRGIERQERPWWRFW